MKLLRSTNTFFGFISSLAIEIATIFIPKKNKKILSCMEIATKRPINLEKEEEK